MRYRHAGFNFDRAANTLASALVCIGEGRTKQSFAEECDINTIVKRFGVTGKLPAVLAPPVVGDFSDTFDFMSAHNAVIAARKSFEALPALVRRRFNNDAAEFVNFCSDAANVDEMRKLGIANPAKVAKIVPPVKVEIVSPVGGEVSNGKA